MQVDDIISYLQLATAEQAHLQKGMNYRVGSSYSVFLMSVRKGAPYADQIDKKTGTLIYEGHDVPRSKGTDPKTIDQPLTSSSGKWTENGKFFKAATDYKTGLVSEPEQIKVYEKIADGIWCYKGFFQLVDARVVSDGRRKVFKFYLQPVQKKILGRVIALPHNRIIPTSVKIEVWQRDQGRCAVCGSPNNLHYDHVIPFSKGGSSLTAENIRILCAKHNLEKSDKILAILPWVGLGVASLHKAGN